MDNRKTIINIIEKKGFVVKGKSCETWKICYSLKTLNENYSITISPLTTKKLNKILLDTIIYWKFVNADEIISYKTQKEISQIIEKIKDILKTIKEKKLVLKNK